MSIASEITRINTNIAAAYTACSDKGATMPQTQNSANLADTIDSIPQGGGDTPTAIVDGSITEYIDNTVTQIRPYAFYRCSSLATCKTNNAQTLGDYAFYNCTSLENIEFNSVTTIGEYVFQGCKLFDPLTFPEATSIGQEAFGWLTDKLSGDRRSIYLPKLVSMSKLPFSGPLYFKRINYCILKKQVSLSGYDANLFVITIFYVPQRYYNWYINATNWSAAYANYPNSIKTIEDRIDFLVGLGYDRDELLSED